MRPKTNRDLEDRCINNIRILSADAVQNANSGHPGMPMGAAAMAFTLWTRFLKHNPRNPQWHDRDHSVRGIRINALDRVRGTNVWIGNGVRPEQTSGSFG